jgi:hypothetical protein
MTQRVESEINRLNEQIMYRVQRGGEAYLSNAMLRGKFALRACIINFRTTPRDIDLTLETVRKSRGKSNLNMALDRTRSLITRLELPTHLARAAGAVLLRHYHSPFRVEQKVNALQEMEEVTAAIAKPTS